MVRWWCRVKRVYSIVPMRERQQNRNTELQQKWNKERWKGHVCEPRKKGEQDRRAKRHE